MQTQAETRNAATVRRLMDATNSHDAGLIARTIDETVDAGATIRTPLPLEVSGAAALKHIFATLHRAFPDLHVAIQDVIEEGDKVVARNVVTGTHLGEYMGRPPTGRSVTYNEIFIFRFAKGRVAETWGVVDVLSQMRQLGFISA